MAGTISGTATGTKNGKRVKPGFFRIGHEMAESLPTVGAAFLKLSAVIFPALLKHALVVLTLTNLLFLVVPLGKL